MYFWKLQLTQIGFGWIRLYMTYLLLSDSNCTTFCCKSATQLLGILHGKRVFHSIRNQQQKDVYTLAPTKHLGRCWQESKMNFQRCALCALLNSEQSCEVANSQSVKVSSRWKNMTFWKVNIPSKIRIQTKKNNDYLTISILTSQFWKEITSKVLMLMLLPSYTRKKPLLTPQVLTLEESCLPKKVSFYLITACFQRLFLKHETWKLSIQYYLILFGLAILAIVD